MKKSTFNNTILYLATLLVSSLLFGCNKSNPETISIKPNIEEIINDVDFKIYLNQVDSLKHHLSGRDNKSIMSQTEFIKIYIKAIKENDVEAQKLISNQMGYDENQFWESRLIRINLIQKLNSRYDLSKIELNHFQKEYKKRALMYDIDECVEIYKICKDNVTATYAMDQITCIASGALGFTGIGVIVFVGCEAAAVYRMYQGDRNCNINYKYCK